MPCDLGYKSFTSVTVPVPTPLSFKKKTAAPKVDADLMALIGQDDPVFLEFIDDLDIVPLLRQALDAALAEIGATRPVTFAVEAGGLSAEATYKNASEKGRIEAIADRVGRRWQMEVLAIVARLLDFEVQISVSRVDGREVVTLEGERHGDGQVNEYLRVTLDPAKGSSVMFEHFASPEKLAAAKAKFLGLAQKLGIRLRLGTTRESGSPIPAGEVHKHFLKRGK